MLSIPDRTCFQNSDQKQALKRKKAVLPFEILSSMVSAQQQSWNWGQSPLTSTAVEKVFCRCFPSHVSNNKSKPPGVLELYRHQVLPIIVTRKSRGEGETKHVMLGWTKCFMFLENPMCPLQSHFVFLKHWTAGRDFCIIISEAVKIQSGTDCECSGPHVVSIYN